jgi:hypothetical protein
MKESKSANKNFAFLIAVLITVILCLTWYWMTVTQDTVMEDNFDFVLTPGNEFSEKISQDLNKKIHGDADLANPDTNLATDDSAMQAKLRGLIRGLGQNRLPTDEELNRFYEKNKRHYGGGSNLTFLYRPFYSRQYGGQATEKARQALENKIIDGDPLTRRERLPKDGYFSGFYEWANEKDSSLYTEFGAGFGEKILALIAENDSTDLPCWDGPIGGKLGSYLICIEHHVREPYPALNDIREELINDWRLAESRKQSKELNKLAQ